MCRNCVRKELNKTVKTMKEVAENEKFDIEPFAFQLMIAAKKSPYQVCVELDRMFREEIKEEPQPVFKQYLKTPLRFWNEKSGDVKCVAVFFSSVLRALGIPHEMVMQQINNSVHYLWLKVDTEKGVVHLNTDKKIPFNISYHQFRMQNSSLKKIYDKLKNRT